MKAKKRLIALVASIGILGVAGTAYAADIKSPADIAAGLTRKSITEINTDRAAGKTYGTIAKEAGQLDQFKIEMLDQKKAILDQRVKDGILTQQQADIIYKAIETNQATCDGTGSASIGRMNGAGFGRGTMMGQGRGSELHGSMGYGLGQGSGSVQ